ncbi:hypothetical protein CFAEC_01150 [Corynebacterium faecale]|uniref:YhgE/Pip domain-containing protein n=1 Tax=Corynebacterium faecale TaxID=1758466 RepID=UPI0025B3E1AA|nr:YhgE/Pip domain-containing protein [Corynebacterium faecale]WJY91091.1 hypothetical protein CFAEC_01150 [Corynebacterium faecale]
MSVVVAPTETPATRRGGILAALLLLVPLIAGTAFVTATDMDISRSWSAAGEVTGAPAPASANSQDLIDARRAAGEAGAQAGFLASGTGELTAGTKELVDAATPLQEGVGAAAEGARELHEGLIQLQAGTGQMGTGATEIADGVASAVEQMTGLVILTQQIRVALDQADRDLAAMDRPEAEEVRGQLANLKGELEQVGLDVEMTDRLDELRSGTRDLANQLAVPGYGYHDGIYTATNGAAELAAGLGELEAGVGEAVAGFTALDEGASRLDAMAALNKEKTGAVQRALPAPQVPAAGVELTAAGPEGQSASLPPMYAFLIATVVMLAGAALGWVTLRNRWLLAFVLLGITALGGVVLFTVALGLSAAALAGAVAVLLLATIVSAVITRVLIHAFGVTGAVITTVIGWIAQVAVVGHVWNTTAVAEIGTMWQILAGLMPLHYPTFALTALGNGGALTPVWVGVAVLAGLLLLGGVMLRRRAPVAAIEMASDDLPNREGVQEEATTSTP